MAMEAELDKDSALARGVPLAIINKADRQMYFAADGNRRLTRFHQNGSLPKVSRFARKNR